jgi:hypothetical protein
VETSGSPSINGGRPNRVGYVRVFVRLSFNSAGDVQIWLWYLKLVHNALLCLVAQICVGHLVPTEARLGLEVRFWRVNPEVENLSPEDETRV